MFSVECRTGIFHDDNVEIAIRELTSGLCHAHIGDDAGHNKCVDSQCMQHLVESGGIQRATGVLGQNKLARFGLEAIVNLAAWIIHGRIQR